MVAIVYIGVKIGFGGIFDAAMAKLETPTASGTPTGTSSRASRRTGPTRPLRSGRPWRCSCTACDDRGAVRPQPQGHPPQRRDLAGVLVDAGVAGVARLRGDLQEDVGVRPGPLRQRTAGRPTLFEQIFPDWFAGVAFSAIAIGALVPAAIMSIVVGLYTRWLHRWALLVGPAGGPAGGLGGRDGLGHDPGLPAAGAERQDQAGRRESGAVRPRGAALHLIARRLPFTHTKVYIAASALVINVLATVILTIILRALKAPAGIDETESDDYYGDVPARDPSSTRRGTRRARLRS